MIALPTYPAGKAILFLIFPARSAPSSDLSAVPCLSVCLSAPALPQTGRNRLIRHLTHHLIHQLRPAAHDSNVQQLTTGGVTPARNKVLPAEQSLLPQTPAAVTLPRHTALRKPENKHNRLIFIGFIFLARHLLYDLYEGRSAQ